MPTGQAQVGRRGRRGAAFVTRSLRAPEEERPRQYERRHSVVLRHHIITAAQGPRKNSFKKALKVSAPLPAAPVAPAESKKSKPKRRCSLPSSDEESPSNPMIQKPAAPVAPEVTDAIAKPHEPIAVQGDSQISTQPQFVAAAAATEEQDATPEPPSKALTRADTEQTIPVR